MIIFLLLTLFCSNVSYADSRIEIQGVSIEFLDDSSAKNILVQDDEFIQNMTPLNYSLRLLSPKPESKESYFDFIKKQILTWDVQEIKSIESSLYKILKNLKNINIQKMFPNGLKFIKTTGLDEGGAYYTRSNAVVVPLGFIDDKTLAHELFHIFTNEHQDKLDDLYSLIGFQPLRSVKLPNYLSHRKIINPDAPIVKHSIKILLGKSYVEVLPVVTSSVSITEINPNEENFFEYVNFNYYTVDGFEPIELSETNFFELVGDNSNYIIHPEEILADNFSLLATQMPPTSPDIIEKLQTFLFEI